MTWLGLLFLVEVSHKGILFPRIYFSCSEGLSALIHQAEDNGRLHGISICRGAPSISHLLFANDCFMFCRATENEMQVLQNIFQVYEIASRQAINLNKFEVLFSSNILEPKRRTLAGMLGVQMMMGFGKYLGMPSLIGRNRKATFNFVKDKVWKKNKFNEWKISL